MTVGKGVQSLEVFLKTSRYVLTTYRQYFLFSTIRCTFLSQNYKSCPRIPIDTEFTGQITGKKNVSKDNAIKLPEISLYCCNNLTYTPSSTIVSSNAQVCAQYTVAMLSLARTIRKKSHIFKKLDSWYF